MQPGITLHSCVTRANLNLDKLIKSNGLFPHVSACVMTPLTVGLADAFWVLHQGPAPYWWLQAGDSMAGIPRTRPEGGFGLRTPISLAGHVLTCFVGHTPLLSAHSVPFCACRSQTAL